MTTIDKAEISGVNDARSGLPPASTYEVSTWEHIAYSRAYAWASNDNGGVK